MNAASDEAVSVSTENFWSAVRTKNVIEPEEAYQKFPALNCVPKKLEMDYSRILNKPFFVKNFTWSSTQAANIVIANLSFPIDFLTNPLVRVPFEASLYYRAKASVLLQVSGTPMHAGVLLASALPIGASSINSSPGSRINTLLTSPHIFLNANESTPALLEIPFYVNTKLASISLDGNTSNFTTYTGNYANIVVQVLNQLSVPTSGSTTLTVSAHLIFKELEFYVPHVNPTYVAPALAGVNFQSESFSETARGYITNFFDALALGAKVATMTFTKPIIYDAIDLGRGLIRTLTGLHNPADTTICKKISTQQRQYNNIVDAPVQLEKLDPYSQFHHYTRDYTFDTQRDEMDVLAIMSKPQFLGNFKVTSADAAGKLLWARPITPYQEVRQTVTAGATSNTSKSVSSLNFTSNQQLLYLLTRYWRGTIKIHVQAVMSNFQYCKLTLARNYSPDIRCLTSVPSFDSIPNLMMESAEFSAGGQVQTFELPFCASMEQLPNVLDLVANALSHGMYYIYLHQPLVNNGSTTYDARFNVYMSVGDDFQLFGYATRPMIRLLSTFNAGIGRSDEDPNSEKEIVEVQQAKETWSPKVSFQAESAEVDASQKDILFKMDKTDDVTVSDLRPIVSVRDFMRRYTRVWYERFVPDDLANRKNIAVFDVASLLGIRGPTVEAAASPGVAQTPATPLQLISSMFLGYSGGSRFKISVIGTTAAEVWYVPPGFSTQAPASIDPTNNRAWRSTIPAAFNNSDPLTSDNQLFTRNLYQFAERDPPLNYFMPRVFTPTVVQERPNYVASSSNLDVSVDAGTGDNRMPMANCLFEFEIPHMVPYRFIGDTTKQKISENLTWPEYNAPTGMGHLVVKVATPVNYYSGSAALPMDVAIEIFAAMDDVGRFGYHTMATNFYPATGFVASNTSSVNDPVWLTSEVNPMGSSSVAFQPYPRASLNSSGTP